MSRYDVVEQGPPIEVFQMNNLFLNDSHQNKVNLTIGAYRDENAKPWVLPIVRKVEKQMAEDSTLLHEYLPVLGLEAFTNASVAMLLGQDNPAIAEGRAFGVQTLSGTGGLRIGAEFLNKQLHYTTFYYSNPTWENHHLIFMNSGFTTPRQYRYWDAKSRSLDIEGFLEDLRNAPENAVIILHACAHNPTGIDPTREQWERIADVVQERKLFPFFDSAYQGFASGDLDRDAWAVRRFVERGIELVCAQSYAKNFGLYNERVGNLTFVLASSKQVAPVKSQLTWIVRGMYSNPPAHGARVVATVLNNPALFDEWRSNIQMMSTRVIQMREALRAELIKLGTPGSWDHIVAQIGLFSYTGLTPAQAERLVQHYHVYLLRSGRINICGLNPGNIQYVAAAIHDAVTTLPAEDVSSKL
ncbi:aspartate aminotransferase, cytoplasmic isoform X2 [Plutella xylostella]|uniref:aspartate aminotransferase, cytoplasmic isoform X2 n=1 Tax=Plutella xylostella TaxID=51655 RepID=UPI0018D0B44C|nr:aspartate aminotransferase, cytoplasmic isoform X2 [Plutella xylostella]